MESNEVSEHEVRVYMALRDSKKWVTAKDVSGIAKVAPRTARAHLSKLASLGLVDTAEVFPAHRYRLSEKADKRNAAYVARVTRAIEVFGM